MESFQDTESEKIDLGFFNFVFQDWKANSGNTKGRLVLFLFRVANFCSKRKVYYYLGFPYLIFYKLFVEWFLTIEIPWNLVAGKNLTLYHGQCLVIAEGVVIGNNCTIRHGTTIGNRQLHAGGYSQAPKIGNNVDIGCNTCIIGGIVISSNVTIGSGSVVVKSVEPNCVIVGNPARVIRNFSTLNQDIHS